MKHIYLSAFILLALLSSCSKRFYAPALYQQDISYMPKPASFDSSKSAAYLSIGGGFNQGASSNNTISFGEFNLSAGHTFKNLNVAYGAFGAAGGVENSNYDYDKNEPNSFSSKAFANVGGRASLNFYEVMGNANFRFIGVEAAYSKEFGDYAGYRRMVSALPDYNVVTRTELFTLGGTSEVLWHGRSTDKNHAIRLFVGKTFGDFSQVRPNNDNSIYTSNLPLYLSVSYFMRVSKFWGAAELTKNDYSFPGLRVKLGYRF